MTEPLLIFGGTRGTGLAVARRLRRLGRDFAVVARDPRRARVTLGPDVEIRPGDVTDTASVTRAFERPVGAVLFAVDITGPMFGRGFLRPPRQIRDVLLGGLARAADAAERAVLTGPFVLVSTIGSVELNAGTRLLNRLKPGAIDASRRKAERLRASGLRWTVVQAGVLHDGDHSNSPLQIEQGERPLTPGMRLSRGNLAQVLVAALDHPDVARETFDVWGGDRVELDAADLHARLSALR